LGRLAREPRSAAERVRLLLSHRHLHAFTTRASEPGEIAKDTIHILKDWLAAGIDPERATIVVQSEVPAIVELTREH